MKINIQVGTVTLEGELHDTETARKISDILPFTTVFDTWGDEIYFSVPVRTDLDETAREAVAVGDLGYWPTGNAFCIFFGPTPMSTQDKIVPASAVNIIGKVCGDATKLRSVMHETRVTVEKA